MSKPLEGGSATAVSRNGVTVQRRLERKGDGIVVTLELTSDVRGPVEVEVVDEFPPALPVEQAGFNVEHEPDDGDVSLERTEIRHTIEESTARVVYAIRLSEGTDGVSFDPPTIRDVTLPGIPDSNRSDDETDPDEEAQTSQAETTTPGADDPEDERESPAPADAASDADGLPDGLSLDGESSGDPDATVDGGSDADPIESAIERAEIGAPEPPDETEGETAPSGQPTPDEPTPGSQADADEEPATGSGLPKSVRLRLDRLNARVEEFAAYAEALEGIIERHGTAPEILEDIESDLADADERLADVRAEVESLESRHDADVEAVGDRVDSLEARLEDARRDLESDVDGVRDDLEAVDDVASDVEVLGARVDDYGDDVDDLGETVERVSREVREVSRSVEAMRSEMEALQDDVDRLLRFREILADVFGGPVRRATEGGVDPFEDAEHASDSSLDRSGTDGRTGDGGPSSPPTGPSG